MAPILQVPDPVHQFLVEVDASEVEVDASELEVGTMLSQQAAKDQILHLCAFFCIPYLQMSTIMTLETEWLAVKMTLKSLVGRSQCSFSHLDRPKKNLECIRTAGRMNAHHAHSALFFTRLKYSLFYRPGSCNLKPDVLFSIFGRDEEQGEASFPILIHLVGK